MSGSHSNHTNSARVTGSAGVEKPAADSLAGVLSEFTHTLLTNFSIEAILHHLVRRIVDILPIDSAGVTLMTPTGAARQIAGSEASVMRYEALQAELGKGPCIEAFRSREAVSIPDLEHDDRFPEFSQRALEEGLAAVFTIPLRTDGRCLGALDLYRSTTGALTPSDQGVAQTLADAATAYLLNAEARTAQRDLVAHVSHELRTPLASIIGNVELLRDGHGGTLSLEQNALIDAVARSSERLRVLANGLLNASRLTSGASSQPEADVDMAEVVRAATQDLTSLSRTSRVELSLDVSHEPVLVRGDSAGLRSLVDNLISNAVKFTAPGGWVRCTLTQTSSTASVRVSDNGRGIPESDQAKLFNKYFQSETTHQSPFSGSGLGLSIVDSIAKRHHGTVTVTSTPQLGTTFTVELPLSGSWPARDDPQSAPP